MESRRLTVIVVKLLLAISRVLRPRTSSLGLSSTRWRLPHKRNIFLTREGMEVELCRDWMFDTLDVSDVGCLA